VGRGTIFPRIDSERRHPDPALWCWAVRRVGGDESIRCYHGCEMSCENISGGGASKARSITVVCGGPLTTVQCRWICLPTYIITGSLPPENSNSFMQPSPRPQRSSLLNPRQACNGSTQLTGVPPLLARCGADPAAESCPGGVEGTRSWLPRWRIEHAHVRMSVVSL